MTSRSELTAGLACVGVLAASMGTIGCWPLPSATRQVNVILSGSSQSCRATQFLRPHDPDHGERLNFVFTNNCGANQFAAITWEGQDPFDQCHGFVVAQMFRVPEGDSYPGSCRMKDQEGSKKHCTHHLVVIVRSSAENVPEPKVDDGGSGCAEDHSLDYDGR
jgi:hypothetical protein